MNAFQGIIITAEIHLVILGNHLQSKITFAFFVTRIDHVETNKTCVATQPKHNLYSDIFIGLMYQTIYVFVDDEDSFLTSIKVLITITQVCASTTLAYQLYY